MRTAGRYSFAVLTSALALGVASVLPYHGTSPVFIFFTVAVALSAWFGGLRSGLLAWALTLLSAVYLITSHRRGLATLEVAHFVRLISLSAVSLAGVFVVAKLRKTLDVNSRLLERERMGMQESERLIRELRQLEERSMLLSRGTRDGVWDWNLETNEVWWNSAYNELFGKRPRETTNSPGWWFEHIHPDDVPIVKGSLERALRGRADSWQCEYQYKKADGKYADVLDRAYIYRDLRDKAIRVVGSMQDLTARKQAEAAILQSEKRYAALASATFEGIAITENWRIVEVNEQLANMLGYTPEEMIGRDAISFFTPEDSDRVRNDALELSGHIQHGMVRKDGSRITVEGRGKTIMYRDRPMRVSVIRDISERVRLEEELRRRAEELAGLMSVVPVAIWVAHDPECTVITGNPMANSFYDAVEGENVSETKSAGWKPTGRRFFYNGRELAPEELPVQYAAAHNTEVRNVELDVLLRTGKSVNLLGSATPLRDERGQVRGCVGAFMDITEHKRAQSALIQNEKLASTGRMAATIAHEINNPLAAAMNALYLAGLDQSVSPATREVLAIADEELKRAAQITRQTLGFYRENGLPSAVQVEQLVESVLTLYRQRIQNRNITVRAVHRSAPAAYAVEGELRQIVANLLSNAIDATPERGIIHVRTSSLNGRVCLTIADTGAGIPSGNLKRVFEPFFTTKDKIGTGLGLWIVRELVRKHRGRIRLRSRSGRGTVFSISLPAAEAAQKMTASKR
jgi:PAS domain S-box-containing protein